VSVGKIPIQGNREEREREKVALLRGQEGRLDQEGLSPWREFTSVPSCYGRIQGGQCDEQETGEAVTVSSERVVRGKN
jgi:hypothetical protein